jgi:putative pyruvate formate lyase activating enzyme
MPAQLVISSAGPHFGEESVLVGRGGSGTIFLTGCNLLCIFCQNYDISHDRRGEPYTEKECARVMMRLERIGCENINFVTPTHFAPLIMKAIDIARSEGLKVPIVYNCGGYESVEMLKLLDGFIQIYMPDIKFLNKETAKKLCNAEDYPDVIKATLREMHRQVGDLTIENGIATKGLLVRHLVMPEDCGSTYETIDFLAQEISPHTFVNVMGQYRPVYRAHEVPAIDKYPSMREIERAREYAATKGLRLD